MAGMANSVVAGYFGGGDTATNIIDKITFPADTKTTISAVLSGNTTSLAAMANGGI